MIIKFEPKIVHFAKRLPYYFSTNSPISSISDITSDSGVQESLDTSKSLVKGHSRLKFNFFEGSENSIAILRALVETERTEALRTEFVQALVGYKWNKFFRIIATFAFIDILDLITLIGIVFFNDEFILQILTILLLVFNMIFFMIEVLQFVSLGKKYFRDLQNYIDLLKIFGCFSFGTYVLVDGFGITNSSHWLTFLVTLLSFLQSLVIFQTRHYIGLIEAVTVDIVPFFVILIYFVLGYCTVMATTNDLNFVDSFKGAYELILGDFDTSNMSDLQWLIFFFGAIFNVIMTLNLLISIISESFDKISFTSKEAETRTRMELILEVEECMFWNRQKGIPTYLYLLKEYEGEEETSWESRIRKLFDFTYEIRNTINKRFDALNQELTAQKSASEKQMQELQQKLQEITQILTS